jgi:cytochrome c oxidase subunit 3
MADPRPHGPFDDEAQRVHASELGLWVFLASEALLFAGLLALHAAMRAHHPAAFGEGVPHATRVLGSVNTAVLLTSSYAVAASVRALRDGRRWRSLALLGLTIALGAAFLVIKVVEYARHLREGIGPGARGRFFAAHAHEGLATFWTLYYATTGLHAVHVAVGLAVLAWLWLRVAAGTVSRASSHPLALGAMYWHFVDVVWIFVWPLYYLTGSARP